MIKRLLQLFRIKRQDKTGQDQRYTSDYQARQKSFNQIKQASKYVI